MLFQHAISYLREHLLRGDDDLDEKATSSILFVTVSNKLQQELRRRYKDVKDISQKFLPPITFFSLLELLQYLLDSNGIQKTTTRACSYLHFVYDRKSHQKQLVEST